MGPITLPRVRSVRLVERRELAAGVVRNTLRTSAHTLQTLAVLILPAVLGLASSQTRQWLSEALVTITVVGGFLAAPILTVTAWIGLTLPEGVPLHRASTALFLIAIIWMAFALIGAHLHHHHTYLAEQEE